MWKAENYPLPKYFLYTDNLSNFHPSDVGYGGCVILL